MARLLGLAVLMLAAVLSGCDMISHQQGQSTTGFSASEHVIELTELNFQEQVLEAQTPVVVDCWATWCGPCQRMSPVVAELADQTAGRFVVGSMNVDSQQKLAEHYQIQSIPAFLFFKDGELLDTVTGVTSKSDLLHRLEALE